MYTPWVGRKFGVEMEMNDVKADNTTLDSAMIRDAIRSGLSAAGAPARRLNPARASYYHSDGSTWDVKTDASCGVNQREGWEVASPALEMDADAHCAELRGVCDALTALQPQINKKCGLHVHVEVADFDWQDLQRLVILWARYEPFIFELCPPSRRQNTYCPALRSAEWGAGRSMLWPRVERAIVAPNSRAFSTEAQPLPKFSSLNLNHFWRSQRVEFRLGAGTVSYEKVRRWTQLLLALVQLVKRNGSSIRPGSWSDKGFSVAYMAKMLNLAPSRWNAPETIPAASTELVAWMTARRAQFAAPQSRRQGTTAAPGGARPASGF